MLQSVHLAATPACVFHTFSSLERFVSSPKIRRLIFLELLHVLPRGLARVLARAFHELISDTPPVGTQGSVAAWSPTGGTGPPRPSTGRWRSVRPSRGVFLASDD